MSKKEFIKELKDRLRRLPADEVDNAINYYEEYFDDAGEENEDKTIESLGSPAAVASKIIGEYAINEVKEPKEAKEGKKSSLAPLWITILAICASPIALPLLIALVVIIFAVLITIFALSISGIAVCGGGIVTVIASFWAFTYGVNNGIFLLGNGLLMGAIGAAMTLTLFNLGKATVKGLQKWLGGILVRRGSK